MRFNYWALPISEAAVSILLVGEPKMRVQRNEVNVQTLVSPKPLHRRYSMFMRQGFSCGSCKIMLGAGRADSSDVLSDLSGQIVQMMRVPRIILIYAGFGRRNAGDSSTLLAALVENTQSGHVSLPSCP
jgi:hypothetical protein